MKNKKVLIPIIIFVVLAIGGGVFALTRQKPAENPVVKTPKKKKITEPVNVIAVAERPYVQIKPHADGRNISLVINSLKKNADDADYELEYQAGSLLQGAFGNIALTDLPSTKKILLGSCSAGGACTYHEDVRGGTLSMCFNGSEKYALKSDWNYFINSTRETDFSSKDSKFRISADNLAKQSYIIIYNTPGYPEGLEGNLVSEIYSLTTSKQLAGKAEISIRASEEGDLKIKGWDGKTWQEFDTAIDEEDNKMAKAKADLMGVYVVVKE